jgi:hypothetical protein
VPSTLTVRTNLDSGAGLLRAEIAAAHKNDTIVFAPSLDGQTITLTSGELLINKNLTIAGPGAGKLTVSGVRASALDGALGIWVFEVAAKKPVALSGLTISNGGGDVFGIFHPFDGYGGGILNHSTLTVSGCTVSGNTASNAGGGIANFGTLTVTGGAVSDNSAVNYGGGIYNDKSGTLTVSGCTLSSTNPFAGEVQIADFGGGIYNAGKATVSNSTLSGNSTTYSGGEGGGIYNAGTLTVNGCTLSGNAAVEGGGIYNAGTLAVKHSVFCGNLPNNIFGFYTDGGGNTFG